jgi:hypothetical protein
MADSLGLDTTQLVQDLAKAASSVKGFNLQIGDLISQQVKLNEAGQAVSAMLKFQIKDGQQVAVSFQNTAEEAKGLAKEFQIVGVNLTKLGEAEKASLERLSFTQAKRESADFTAELNRSIDVTKLSQAQTDRLAEAQRNLRDVYAASGARLEDLDAITRNSDLSLGVGESSLKKVIAARRELIQVEHDLGLELENNARKLAAVTVINGANIPANATNAEREKLASRGRDLANAFTAAPDIGIGLSSLNAQTNESLNQQTGSLQNAAKALVAYRTELAQVTAAAGQRENLSQITAALGGQFDQTIRQSTAFGQLSTALKSANIDYTKFSQILANPTATRGLSDSETKIAGLITKLNELKSATTLSLDSIKNQFLGGAFKSLEGTAQEFPVTQSLVRLETAAKKAGLTQSELNDIIRKFELNGGAVDVPRKLVDVYQALTASSAKARTAIQATTDAINESFDITKKNVTVSFPVPSTANVQQNNAYKQSLEAVRAEILRLVPTTANLEQEVNRLSRDIKAGQLNVGDYDASLKGLKDSLVKLDALNKKISDGATSAITSFSNYVRQVAGQISTIVINKVTQSFFAGVEESRKFSLAIAEIGTQSISATTNLEALKAQVIAVSNEFGLARKDVAEGLYQALSNQVVTTSNSLTFLAEAARFARVTNSSLTDSINLGSSAIKAYGLNADDAQEIFAGLFETIKLGRVRASDLANTLGTVGTIGDTAGVSLRETEAAIQTLTVTGVTPANALTFLRNLFKELISPSAEFKKVLESYNFTTGKAAVETLGFVGLLKLLNAEFRGSVERSGDILPNMRSLQAALGLTGRQLETMITNFDLTGKALEDYQQASDLVTKSSGQLFTELSNRIRNSFAGITDIIVTAGASIVNTFGGAANVVTALSVAFDLGLSGAAGTATYKVARSLNEIVKQAGGIGPAFSNATAAISTFVTGLSASAAIAGSIVAAASLGLILYVQETTNVVAKAAAEVEKLRNLGVDARARINSLAIEEVRSANKVINLVFANSLAAVNENLAKQTEAYKTATDLSRQYGEAVLEQRTADLNRLKTLFNEGTSLQQRLTTDLESAKQKNQERIFETQVKGLPVANQVDRRTLEADEARRRAEELAAKSVAAAASGDIKNAENFRRLSDVEYAASISQLEKAFTARDKKAELEKQFKSGFDEIFKKQFELDIARVDEFTKSVKRYFKELKEITADFGKRLSNPQQAVLKDLTRGISEALKEISGRGFRSTLSDLGQQLLSFFNKKELIELKFAIRVQNKEVVDKYINELQRRVEANFAVQKAIAANINAQSLVKDAASAAGAGNFDEQRKLLRDAQELLSKSNAEGFKSEYAAKFQILELQKQIQASYKEEATFKLDKRALDKLDQAERDKVLENLKDGKDILTKQTAIIESQTAAYGRLNEALKIQNKTLETKIKLQEDDNVRVKAVFGEINKITPKAGTSVLDVDQIKKLKVLRDTLFDKPGSALVNFKLYDTLNERIAKSEDARRADKDAKDHESNRVRAEEEYKLRIDTATRINEKRAELEKQYATLKADDFVEETKLINELRAIQGKTLEGDPSADLAVAVKDRDAKFLKAVQDNANTRVQLNSIQQKLQAKDLITPEDIAKLDTAGIKGADGLTRNTAARLGNLIDTFKTFKIELDKPIIIHGDDSTFNFMDRLKSTLIDIYDLKQKIQYQPLKAFDLQQFIQPTITPLKPNTDFVQKPTTANFNINVNGVTDPRRVADTVISEIRRRTVLGLA